MPHTHQVGSNSSCKADARSALSPDLLRVDLEVPVRKGEYVETLLATAYLAVCRGLCVVCGGDERAAGDNVTHTRCFHCCAWTKASHEIGWQHRQAQLLRRVMLLPAGAVELALSCTHCDVREF